MVQPSPSFSPAVLRGIQLNKNNPLQFDFIVDRGDAKLSGKALHGESLKLIKYFMAALAVPQKDLWVNLSPYEKDRIVPERFGQTDMGRDLLAQDYILKQLAASLVYPEKDLGRKFWQKVYESGSKSLSPDSRKINTFNKVWIVPEKAVVLERSQAVYVSQVHLKVMLEDDYLALTKNQVSIVPSSERARQATKELVLPAIEREVNEGAQFAPLRQVFSSLVLAMWYKRTLKQAILNKIYSDSNKIKGIDIKDKNSREKIYQQYLLAFKKGVYSYIKEESQPGLDHPTPKRYFSGGVNAAQVSFVAASPSESRAMMSQLQQEAKESHLLRVGAALRDVNAAQITLEEQNKRLTRSLRTLSIEKAVPFKASATPLEFYKNLALATFQQPIREQRKTWKQIQSLLEDEPDLRHFQSDPEIADLLKIEAKTGSFQRPEHRTSFLAEEIMGADYIRAFFPDVLKEVTEKLVQETPALDMDLSTDDLVRYLRAASDEVLEHAHKVKVKFHRDVFEAVRWELMLGFYRRLLERPTTIRRYPQISANTARDGYQSLYAAGAKGLDQWSIALGEANTGVLSDQEVAGGQQLSNLMKKGARLYKDKVVDGQVNDSPAEDPWVYYRGLLAAYGKQIEDAFGDLYQHLDEKDKMRLMERFDMKKREEFVANKLAGTETRSTIILTEQELRGMLTDDRYVRNGSAIFDERLINKVVSLYRIKREALLRGRYGVGLREYSDESLDRLIKLLFIHGIDIMRGFDATNLPKQTDFLFRRSLAIGADIELAIALGRTSRERIPKIVDLIVKLVSPYKGHKQQIRAVTLKDPGGTMDDVISLLVPKLQAALQENGLGDVPIQIHTHDLRGFQVFRLLEAVRFGADIVDLGTEPVAGGAGQVGIMNFLNMVEGTNLQGDLFKQINREQLEANRRLLSEQFLPYKDELMLTFWERQMIADGQMPGGMFRGNDFEIRDYLKKAASQVSKEFDINILDKEGNFSSDGEKFLAAFYQLYYREFDLIIRDFGETVIAVTPFSDHFGKQAFHNIYGSLLAKSSLADGTIERRVGLIKGPDAWRLEFRTIDQEKDREAMFMSTNFARPELLAFLNDMDEETKAFHPDIQPFLFNWAKDKAENNRSGISDGASDENIRKYAAEINDTLTDKQIVTDFNRGGYAGNLLEIRHLLRHDLTALLAKLNQALAQRTGVSTALQGINGTLDAFFRSGARLDLSRGGQVESAGLTDPFYYQVQQLRPRLTRAVSVIPESLTREGLAQLLNVLNAAMTGSIHDLPVVSAADLKGGIDLTPQRFTLETQKQGRGFDAASLGVFSNLPLNNIQGLTPVILGIHVLKKADF